MSQTKLNQNNVYKSALFSNFIEFYGNGLFISLSGVLTANFIGYKKHLLVESLLFFVAYFIRPIGILISLFLTRFFTKEYILYISILLMTSSLFLMSILPKEISFLSGILLFFLRGLQGISSVLEFPSSIAILTENKKANYFVNSLSFTISVIAIMIAFLLTFLMKNIMSLHSFTHWGWRVLFFLGFLFSIPLLKSRKRLSNVQCINQEFSLNTKINNLNFKRILYIFLISGFIASCFFTLIFFIPKLINDYDIYNHSLGYITIVFYVLSLPIFGKINDLLLVELKNSYKILFIGGFILTFISILLKINAHNEFYYNLLYLSSLSVVIAFIISPTPINLGKIGITDLSLEKNRLIELLIGYNLGLGFIGALVPILLSFLVKNQANWIADSISVFFIFLGCVSVILALFIRPLIK